MRTSWTYLPPSWVSRFLNITLEQRSAGVESMPVVRFSTCHRLLRRARRRIGHGELVGGAPPTPSPQLDGISVGFLFPREQLFANRLEMAIGGDDTTTGPLSAGSSLFLRPSRRKPSPIMATDLLKYKRGERKSYKTKDRKLNAALKNNERAIEVAQDEAAAAEILNTEESGFLEAEGLERTYKFRQDALREAVDVSTAQKAFDLKLDFGAYTCDYTRNGRYLLLGGRRGHITSLDWKSGRLACEFHVNETVRDVKYLHNESLYAVAQKKYVYVYDGGGLEIHCLKNHVEVDAMEFLPYHYLLATIGRTGYLKYQDISTGAVVSEHRSKLGPCSVLRQNRHNAILHSGHANGVVNLWTPNMSEPAVRMLCHRGPVRDVAVDREGRYMVTAGQDGRLKIWDVRTYGELQSYFTPTPASSLSVSDSGLVGVAWGAHVSVWKDALTSSSSSSAAAKQEAPYMTHLQPGSPITNVRFAPFEDFLGVAHESGFTSLIVPGAGEANFDAFEANPYGSKQQRRTTEIRGLLEKLQPNMISLTPFIGDVDPASSSLRKREAVEDKAAAAAAAAKKEGEVDFVPRDKQRGRNSALRRVLRKKNRNVVDERRLKVEALLKQEKEMKADRVAREQGRDGDGGVGGDGGGLSGPTLARFAVHHKRR